MWASASKAFNAAHLKYNAGQYTQAEALLYEARAKALAVKEKALTFSAENEHEATTLATSKAQSTLAVGDIDRLLDLTRMLQAMRGA